ncbi:uncharacterized protein LOC144102177 [Amblyomma americanum]
MVVACSLIFTICAVIVVTLALLMNGSTDSTAEYTSETTGEVFKEMSIPPDIRVNHDQVTSRTVATAAPPQTPQTPRTVATAAPTVPPEPSTKSPREALNERPLVCTMGSKISTGAMFPDDGLCDYIFYDSIYKNRRNLLLNPRKFGNDLRIFLDSYSKYKITAFGLGFAFKQSRHVLANIRGSGRSPLAYFWDRGIFHFGILDTPTENLRARDLDTAVECLKELDSQAETQRRGGNPSFIFYAVVLRNSTYEDQYYRYFKYHYQPDVVIAQGHYYTGDNIFIDCRVFPPTLLNRPQDPNSSYQHDLTTAVDSILTLSRLTRLTKRTLWAVSVTMKGRWTTPLSRNPFGFLVQCVNDPRSESFGSYAEICRDPAFEQQFTYSAEHGAVLTYNATVRRVFTYDNEAGFCKKLCRVQGDHQDQRFGIAAFDLDYEDFSNECASMNKYGTFSRLRALRRIVEFFRTSFKTGADESACLRLVK